MSPPPKKKKKTFNLDKVHSKLSKIVNVPPVMKIPFIKTLKKNKKYIKTKGGQI
jgi:hypothetical protein